ncbi:hypothetical protein, partial [Enterobacter intestinihominis]
NWFIYGGNISGVMFAFFPFSFIRRRVSISPPFKFKTTTPSKRAMFLAINTWPLGGGRLRV